MVKFGRHCRAFAEEHSHLYIIPYDHIRNTLIETIEDNHDTDTDAAAAYYIQKEQAFDTEWHKCLKLASDGFQSEMIALWKIVFEGISSPTSDNIRGALPDTALRLYLSETDLHAAEELLVRCKDIYNTALLNSEALRKLVKKWDKQHPGRQHDDNKSRTLLPHVYGANFTVGQSTLQAGISLIRASLGLNESMDDYYTNTTTSSTHNDVDAESILSSNSSTQQPDPNDQMVLKRKEELEWLKELVQSIASTEQLMHIVAHRGFHSPMDRTDCRPLENSLSAYEAAWTNGIHLCECDVALTKDEKLVLCHDEDFRRLALDPTACGKRKVGDFSYRELLSLPLKNGTCRPPLLVDVLRSACAIGGPSQLIIEIKPGNVAAASALARLFLRYPTLMAKCAVVMSFDAFCMHTLCKDLAHLTQAEDMKGSSVSLPTTMSLGNLGYRVDSISEQLNEQCHSAAGEGNGVSLQYNNKEGESKGAVTTTDSPDSYCFGIGLSDASLSRTRSGSFSFTPFRTACTPTTSPKLVSNTNSRQASPSLAHVTSSSPSVSSIPTGFLLPPRAAPLSSSPSNTLQEQQQQQLRVNNNNSNNHNTTNSARSTKVLPNSPGSKSLSTTNSPKPKKFVMPPIPLAHHKALQQQQQQQQLQPQRPKLMLLTVSEKPKRECELVASVSEDNIVQKVEPWLRRSVHNNNNNESSSSSQSSSQLDGVYLQFESHMLTRDGAAVLRRLRHEGYAVGVWGKHGKDPDCFESFHKLVREGGVSYVNSDLPKGFIKTKQNNKQTNNKGLI